jgi:hypothetical protein
MQLICVCMMVPQCNPIVKHENARSLSEPDRAELAGKEGLSPGGKATTTLNQC